MSNPTKRKEIELECECFGHRLNVRKDSDGIVYICIAEKKRGRPHWVEVVLCDEKVKELIKFLKL